MGERFVDGLISPAVGQMSADEFFGALTQTSGLHRGFREYEDKPTFRRWVLRSLDAKFKYVRVSPGEFGNGLLAICRQILRNRDADCHEFSNGLFGGIEENLSLQKVSSDSRRKPGRPVELFGA
jgi:hypothetical protein